MDSQHRNARFRKAVSDIAANYTITAKGHDSEGSRVFAVTGGSKPYQVVADPLWRRKATCDCPDSRRTSGPDQACKHIMAVLLQDETLLCQCLDFFL